MFGSDILDAGIGLFLVYFLFSALCSAINEWILGHLFHWRAEMLERAIRGLLGDPGITQDFFAHPLVQSLAAEGRDGTHPVAKPSYISSTMFTDTLINLLASRAGAAKTAPDPAALAQVAQDVSQLRGAVAILAEAKLKTALQSLLAGAKDIEEARAKLEQWFNEAMDRATGWYKRHVRIVTAFLALGVAVGFNVDTFTIARSLMENSKLRAALVAAAEQAVRQPLPVNPSANPEETLRALGTRIDSLDLPIGWASVPRPGAAVGLGRAGKRELIFLRPGENLPMKIAGWLVTAGALSMGAPFWFDLLGKFINLRAAGKKPPEAKEKQ